MSRAYPDRSHERLLQAALLAAMAGAFSGCTSKLETAQREHGAAVEAKLTPLESIHEQVLTLPRLDHDSVTHTGAPIRLSMAVPDVGEGNASLSYVEDLANLEDLGYVWGRVQPTGLLNRCASVLRGGHEAYDPAEYHYLLRPDGADAEKLFKRCEGLRTLFVLRTVDFVEPSGPREPDAGALFDPSFCGPHGTWADAGNDGATRLIGRYSALDAATDGALGAASDGAAEGGRYGALDAASDGALDGGRDGELDGASDGGPEAAADAVLAAVSAHLRGEDRRESPQVFRGGFIRAEILVFDLDGARYEGGFRIEVASSPRVTGSVVEDLRTKLSAAIADGIKKHVPGVVLEGAP